jgi:hypothetical protein
VARDIFSYVERDLTHPEGGFYSAEDADSLETADAKEKREGAFYVWTAEEIGDPFFEQCYGVKAGGNVDEDPHGEFDGRNILYRACSVEQDDARAALRATSARLLEARAKRPRPHLDDKVLSGWNGLMISAFAKGAQILGEERYLGVANAAARFLRKRLWDESRQLLLRRFRDGESAIDGFLDDYAFCALAFLDLYEAGFDSADLRFAVTLAERALVLFEDRQNGGFFSTAEGAENLVLRLKDDYDGAEPSGNSAMAIALLRLARLSGREDFLKAAERTLEAFSTRLTSGGAGVPQMLCGLSYALSKPMEIVLAGPLDPAMLASIRRRFLPNAAIAVAADAPTPMPAIGEKSTVYVCQNFACHLPVTEISKLDELLE